MSYQTYTHFTAILALTANVATLALVVSRRRSRVAPSPAMWGAAGVAGVATVGSFIYSLGFDLQACDLCWYQRIAMCPLLLILGVAAFRGDLAGARRYGLPLAAGGGLAPDTTICSTTFPVWRPGPARSPCRVRPPTCGDTDSCRFPTWPSADSY